MNKGLLVDYGGVLTTSVLDSFAAFCETEAIDAVAFRDALLAAAREPDSPFARVEIGALAQEEFDVAVAELLTRACGTPIEPRDLKKRMFAATRPDEEMWAAVRAARDAGIRTALVSNSWGGGDYPLDAFDGMFDVLVISGEVGMRKPEPEIYLHAAKAIDTEPSACVFVDDFRVNIDGARAVGMQGVLHRSAAETIAELQRLLDVPLRG